MDVKGLQGRMEGKVTRANDAGYESLIAANTRRGGR